MSLLTAEQLTKEIIAAADMLRGRWEPSRYLDAVTGVLVLKWASDHHGVLEVPDGSRWSHIVEYMTRNPGPTLSEALRALRLANIGLLGDALNDVDYTKLLSHSQLVGLIERYDQIMLGADKLEFDDVVGQAYDHFLGELVYQTGRKGGEFFTPRSVIQLMIRLVRPQEGQSVYDPYCGSAGTLVYAKRYVDEHAGRDAQLDLFGQEVNRSTWSTARLNLLLHGVPDASILCGDSLSDPLHLDVNGRPLRFDCVLANPPFSTKYAEREVRSPERMRYGWSPGQRADLMHIQHVLATLKDDGVAAIVAPHGVLFRGGVEGEIRRGIVQDNRVEAVIGIGPNVFYGTSIPACILVLRGVAGTPDSRRGQVLFINAEREVVTGRTQNRLDPQHIEKILEAYRNWSDIANFSRAVSLSELEANDFNLNIRRYVDSAAAAETELDSRAVLFGGVPRKEVRALERRCRAFDIEYTMLFRPKSSAYYDFLPEGCSATAARIPGFAAAKERELVDRFDQWWEAEAAPVVSELAGTKRLLRSRTRFGTSFCGQPLLRTILGRSQLAGVFANWWADRHADLRALDYRGFTAVMDRWGAEEPSPSDHVLAVLGADLRSRVHKLVVTERQVLVDAFLTLGDRYETSLRDLEQQRAASATRLAARLSELGYF